MSQTSRDLQHPVWDIYDEYRTARLNVKINQYKLANAKTINFLFEFTLALSASSSVASFWFLQNSTGQLIWKYLLVFTAILAILKPLMNPSSKIQKFSELLTDFKNLDHDFSKLSILINQQKKYDTDFQEQFFYLLDQKRFIDQKSSERTIRKIKKLKFEREVSEELPAESFFIPGEQ